MYNGDEKMRNIINDAMSKLYVDGRYSEKYPGKVSCFFVCPICGMLQFASAIELPQESVTGYPLIIDAPPNIEVCNNCSAMKFRYPEMVQWVFMMIKNHELKLHELNDDGLPVRNQRDVTE